MEMYLLKSAACLAILFIFYKLLLEQTSLHVCKRFYLLGSVVASLLIPLLIFKTYVEVSPVTTIAMAGNSQTNFYEAEETFSYLPYFLWIGYAFGLLLFSLKFSRNLLGLLKKIQQNPTYRNRNYSYVLVRGKIIPHTFFNYIFLNKRQFENREIPKEVLLHEEAHAAQKHSIDILFVEIVQLLFWFNPLFYFLKKSIKLNHEFLADRAVLKTGAETTEYQKILLAFSSSAQTPSLANSLNYSSIKKRFTVMKTHTSKRAIWLRSLVLLPLLCLLVYGFSSEEIISQVNLNKNNSEANKILDITISADEKIYIDNEVVTLNKLDEKITLGNYDKASISSSSEVSIAFAQQVVIKLIEKNLANELCISVNSDGTEISESYVKEILEPLHQKIQSKNKNTPQVSIVTENLYLAPEAPPAPNTNKLEYIRELAKRGAIFYIGPHTYSADEAIELVKKSTNEVTIDVRKYPIVMLGGC